MARRMELRVDGLEEAEKLIARAQKQLQDAAIMAVGAQNDIRDATFAARMAVFIAVAPPEKSDA